MYTLLSGLYKYLTQKDEYFVLILGLDNAGKTTYLEQTKIQFSKGYHKLNLSGITTTVGMNIGSIMIDSNKLNFWDLGGQEELQSLWDKYYSEAHAVIYIIDASDPSRLIEAKSAFKKMIQNRLINGLPLLILTNKQDVENCLSIAQIKNEFKPFLSNVQNHEYKFFPTSAINGDGIQNSIIWLMESVKANKPNRPPKLND